MVERSLWEGVGAVGVGVVTTGRALTTVSTGCTGLKGGVLWDLVGGAAAPELDVDSRSEMMLSRRLSFSSSDGGCAVCAISGSQPLTVAEGSVVTPALD